MVRSDFLDLDCLAYATRRTGRAITNLFNARMSELELSVAQFGLLTAVSMMLAGYDGSKGPNPGIPKNGQWNVKWEGLKKMP